MLYTFASPMVGDATFAAAFDALRLTSSRIVMNRTSCRKLPGGFFGYEHIGPPSRKPVTLPDRPGEPRRVARHGDVSRPGGSSTPRAGSGVPVGESCHGGRAQRCFRRAAVPLAEAATSMPAVDVDTK